MFQHPLRDQQTHEVHVDGFDEATTKSMLRFIYSEKLEATMLGKQDALRDRFMICWIAR